MRITPPVAERFALALLAALFVALAVLAPIAQPQQYHRLADMRPLALGAFVLPNAADVLTSLPFTLVGIAGLLCCRRAPPAQRTPLTVFFAGLTLTGAGSAWYHLGPTDASLVWDRLPMTVAFAGALGAVAAERLGAASGPRWLAGWLMLGLASVAVWRLAGDLRLYGVAQYGGLALLLLWTRLPAANGALRLPWGLLLAAYVVAKGFEVFDRELWVLTDGLIAGHAVKHVVTALGVVPLMWALLKVGLGDAGRGAA
jgi:hypothetical protein